MKAKKAPETDPEVGWLTPDAAARYISAHPLTIYRACRVGGLKHVRINGHRKGAIRIKREWLHAWMEEHATTFKF